MKTMYFEDFKVLGFELESVQDVINALNLGLNIVSENGDFLNGDREGEDGNERPATTDEIIEDAQTAFRVDDKIYAVIPVPTDKMLVPCMPTNLSSGFYVGQDVYTLQDGKIRKAKILRIWLSEGSEKFILDASTLAYDIQKEIEQHVNTPTHTFICDKIDKYKAMDESMVYVSYSEKYYGKHLLPLREVFDTKEDLIKHLMEG